LSKLLHSLCTQKVAANLSRVRPSKPVRRGISCDVFPQLNQRTRQLEKPTTQKRVEAVCSSTSSARTLQVHVRGNDGRWQQSELALPLSKCCKFINLAAVVRRCCSSVNLLCTYATICIGRKKTFNSTISSKRRWCTQKHHHKQDERTETPRPNKRRTAGLSCRPRPKNHSPADRTTYWR
jgi:hypothetical protein